LPPDEENLVVAAKGVGSQATGDRDAACGRLELEAGGEVVGAGLAGAEEVAGVPVAENGDRALEDLAAGRRAGGGGELAGLGQRADLPAVLLGQGGEGLGLAGQRPTRWERSQIL
jgi:hypothetical protein